MPAKESSSVHVKVSKILPHPSAVSRARVHSYYLFFICLFWQNNKASLFITKDIQVISYAPAGDGLGLVLKKKAVIILQDKEGPEVVIRMFFHFILF